MITWETIVGIATFGGFLFGFYWLLRTDMRDLRAELRTDMREMSGRFDQKFDAINVKFDAVNAKFDTVNANLADVSERLAVVEERTREK